MRRLALRSALSAKVAEGRAVVIDELKMSAPKTKEVQDILSRLKVDSSALILLPGGDTVVTKSVNNLPDVKTLHAMYLNVADLLDYDYLVMPRAAIEMVESYLG
jgi:large subunit ribosomal protein L4